MFAAFGQSIDVVVQHDDHGCSRDGGNGSQNRRADRMILQIDIDGQDFGADDEREPAGVVRRVADFCYPNRNGLSLGEGFVEIYALSVNKVGGIVRDCLNTGFGWNFSFDGENHPVFLDGGYNCVVNSAEEGICFHLFWILWVKLLQIPNVIEQRLNL